MNLSLLILRRLVLLTLVLFPAPRLMALFPEPPNVWFGRIRGEGGASLSELNFPLLLQAFVDARPVLGRPERIMVAETVVLAHSVMPELPDFRLVLRLDGGGIELYHPMALVEGERVELLAIYWGFTNSVARTLLPAVGPRGTSAEVHVSLPCADADQDGLCNDCEYASFFSVKHPTRGEDDFDGDGYTNADECALGTDPTDASSVPGGFSVPQVGLIRIGGELHLQFGGEWDPQSVQLQWAESVVGPFSVVPSDMFNPGTRSVRVGEGHRFFRLVRLP